MLPKEFKNPLPCECLGLFVLPPRKPHNLPQLRAFRGVVHERVSLSFVDIKGFFETVQTRGVGAPGGPDCIEHPRVDFSERLRVRESVHRVQRAGVELNGGRERDVEQVWGGERREAVE